MKTSIVAFTLALPAANTPVQALDREIDHCRRLVMPSQEGASFTGTAAAMDRKAGLPLVDGLASNAAHYRINQTDGDRHER